MVSVGLMEDVEYNSEELSSVQEVKWLNTKQESVTTSNLNYIMKLLIIKWLSVIVHKR